MALGKDWVASDTVQEPGRIRWVAGMGSVAKVPKALGGRRPMALWVRLPVSGWEWNMALEVGMAY